MSIPNWVPVRSRSRYSRLGNEAKAAHRLAREPDAETLRLRTAYDSKGQTLREGCTYTATEARPWVLRRSVAGRVDQVDLLIAGRLVRTCGLGEANRAIRWAKWRRNA